MDNAISAQAWRSIRRRGMRPSRGRSRTSTDGRICATDPGPVPFAGAMNRQALRRILHSPSGGLTLGLAGALAIVGADCARLRPPHAMLLDWRLSFMLTLIEVWAIGAYLVDPPTVCSERRWPEAPLPREQPRRGEKRPNARMRRRLRRQAGHPRGTYPPTPSGST